MDELQENSLLFNKFLFRKIYTEDANVYPTRKFLYELTPLVQGEIYKPNYFYLPERNQYLIKTSIDFPDVMDTETGWSDRRQPTKRYLLLNYQGQVQTSFDTLINFSRYSGVFFAPDIEPSRCAIKKRRAMPGVFRARVRGQ